MKVALISDLHGNKLALDAVLEDIFDSNVDEIWCLGDLAMAGYDPNYTISKMKELSSPDSKVKTRCIFGNTDKMILNFDEQLAKKVLEVASPMGYALEDDVRIITPENKEFLGSLPQNETITISNKKFFLCHGSPRRVDENIYPDTPQDVVCEMVAPTNADVVFCGHTHIPCGFTLPNAQNVVNAGSVGRPMNPDKSSVWVLLEVFESGDFEILYKFVKYDNVLASKKILERGLKECEKLADMLLRREDVNG